MIDGMYIIKVDVPIGRKEGTVVLETDGNNVIADIDAPVIGVQHVVGRVNGEDRFIARGSGKVKLLGKITYIIEGRIDNKKLLLTIRSNKGDIKLEGARV